MHLSDMKINYTKPALTIGQQIELLKRRGMLFRNLKNAKHHLAQLNYYRLGAYWLPFEVDNKHHTLKPGTTFERIIEIYFFDKELRLLLLDAIESIEVSVRTQIAFQLSHQYGPHALLNKNLFKTNWNYSRNIEKLIDAIKSSREGFIKHYSKKYTEQIPPIWVTVEAMSLGQLSQWYANLSKRKDRNLIAHQYGFDESTFVSFLHHLSIVRNICAHHARVWNRDFTITFKFPKHRPSNITNNLNSDQPKKIFNTLVVIIHMLEIIYPGNQFTQNLTAIIDKNTVDHQQMGFKANRGLLSPDSI